MDAPNLEKLYISSDSIINRFHCPRLQMAFVYAKGRKFSLNSTLPYAPNIECLHVVHLENASLSIDCSFNSQKPIAVNLKRLYICGSCYNSLTWGKKELILQLTKDSASDIAKWAPNLQYLSLGNTVITDAVLELKGLEVLEIGGQCIGRINCPKLKSLCLTGIQNFL